MKHRTLICIAVLFFLTVSLTGYSQPQKERTPFLLDFEQATLIRDRLKTGQASGREKNLLKNLTGSTRKYMTAEKLPSVMDKTMIAESGNRHDYFSTGPYWWPNPATPDGLPYIRKDGVSNPDRNMTDATALSLMTNGVKTLIQAWFYSGDEKYAKKAIEYLRVWFLNDATKMNPHFDYAQAIPGVCPGRGVGIIDTNFWPEFIDSLVLLESYSGWSERDQKELKEWFESFYQWLKTSKNGRDEFRANNNHGSSFDLQTACYALYLGKNDEAREIIAGVRDRRLKKQIQPDGAMPHELARTKSMSYTSMNLDIFLNLAKLGRRFDIDLWLPEESNSKKSPGVQRAVDYLLPYIMEGKEWKYKNISNSTLDRSFRRIMQKAWQFSGDEKYKAAYEKLSPKEQVENLTHLP